jgi:hypothetical protein
MGQHGTTWDNMGQHGTTWDNMGQLMLVRKSNRLEAEATDGFFNKHGKLPQHIRSHWGSQTNLLHLGDFSPPSIST